MVKSEYEFALLYNSAAHYLDLLLPREPPDEAAAAPVAGAEAIAAAIAAMQQGWQPIGGGSGVPGVAGGGSGVAGVAGGFGAASQDDIAQSAADIQKYQVAQAQAVQETLGDKKRREKAERLAAEASVKPTKEL